MIHFLAMWWPDDWSALSIPSWAVDANAQCFYYGLFMAFLVRGFRASVRWMKRVGRDDGQNE